MSAVASEHYYTVEVEWVGNTGTGTSSYSAYTRDHVIRAANKLTIAGSSDPAFRGNVERWNPEELLVAALSACHQLWYLHLCAVAGIEVIAYRDEPSGIMIEDVETGGHFTQVSLRPDVAVRLGTDEALALALHREAHRKCFIANSMNFPIDIVPNIIVDSLQSPFNH
jgi:organic hydroperoxide reductase OsmC/OhrA